MIVASWNVNSITVRQEAVLKWLETAKPDVLCLQETKVINDKFPAAAFQQRGYYCDFVGQPSYNGVAILSKTPLLNVEKYIENTGDESAKRFIKGEIGNSIIINTYVPNGQTVGSDKFSYKLSFLEAVKTYLSTKYQPTEHIIWCGDFNIAPAGIDTYDAGLTDGLIMCSDSERHLLSELNNWGLIDTFRMLNQEAEHYSWWDYREGAFRRNLGYRIDHVWASQPLAKICTKAFIDKEPRKWDRPSDHVPVLAEFKI